MWQTFKNVLIALIWPIIKDLLMKLLRELLDWLNAKTEEMFTHRATSNAEQASAKADDYEDKARYAKSKEEAMQHEAVAKVWREVAELFRRENEEMKRQLDELKREAKTKSEDAIANLGFEEVIDATGEEFKPIDDSQILKLR